MIGKLRNYFREENFCLPSVALARIHLGLSRIRPEQKINRCVSACLSSYFLRENSESSIARWTKASNRSKFSSDKYFATFNIPSFRLNLRKMGFVFFLFFFLSISDQLKAQNQTKAQIQKVAGDYRIEKIIRTDTDSFKIVFHHVNNEEPFATLVLFSNHIHVGLAEGQVLRLSAEVLKRQETFTEVAQVLAYVPTDYGKTPVWLLSQNRPQLQLRGAKFIEMHAPAADYAIF